MVDTCGVSEGADVVVAVGEGEGVSVGKAIAVWVKPDANVATALVCIVSGCKEGVVVSSLDPQAFSIKQFNNNIPISVSGIFVRFKALSPWCVRAFTPLS